MTRPRKELVCIENTPYYHISSRCVRRTFLCGIDRQTGRNYEHRRQWIVDRIRLLASLFTIDISSYAVMSNHYHIIVKLSPDEANGWSDDEVIKRWLCLYKGPLLAQRYQSGDLLTSAEQAALSKIASIWRQRLTGLDWFMKCLNEPIARAANKEDECTGHFWEARYSSKGLPTDEAVLSCMVYVDLNPIRAGIAVTPETSDHTSIQARIRSSFDLDKAVQGQVQQDALQRFDLPLKPLLPFSDAITDSEQPKLPFNYIDYLALLDWTGRVIREGKRGSIPEHLPPILERLSITGKNWLLNTQNFEQHHTKNFIIRKKRKIAA